MRRLLVLVASLVVGSAVARTEPEPPPKGTLRLAMVGPLATLDPAKAASETERICVGNAYDQLYEHAYLDRPTRLVPALAEALPEISEDGLTQTIRIREGARFVDDPCFESTQGRQVTARDVAWCLLRMMDASIQSPGQWMFKRKIRGLDAFVEASAKIPASPSRSAYRKTEGYPQVDGLEVVDDRTLRIHLLEPMPELAWLLASVWTSVYPPEAVRTYGERFGTRLVGSGPYRLVLFLKDEQLVLRRNPDYREARYPRDGPRGADLQDAGLRLPRNERVEIAVRDAPLAVWATFTNGDCDLAEIPRDAFAVAVDVHTGQTLPHLAERGIRVHRTPRLEIFYDAFNWEDPVVGKPAGEKGRALRYAIGLAVDEVYAMTRLYTYQAERVFTPVLPELNAYDPRLRNDALRAEDESEADALAAARQMLSDAGYDAEHPPPPLKMHILSDATSRTVFDILQQQVARVGIRVDPVPVTWPEMQQALRGKKAQMWSSAWYADYPDAQNFLQLFYGPNAPEPNYCNYQNAEVDALYEEARGLPPGDERDGLLEDVAKLVVADAPWRIRFRRIRWDAVQPWVRGYAWNDIAPKHFKHIGVDDDARAKPR